MSAKGVVNPWAPRPAPVSASRELASMVQQEEPLRRPPLREATFDGRAFQIAAAFYTFDRDVAALAGYGRDALGRCLAAALKADTQLARQFALQGIATDPAKMLAPKVTLECGAVTLYVKASSFDPTLARLMAVDRVALAMADARNASKAVRATLEEHGVVVSRKA